MALQGALDKSENSNSALSVPRVGRFPVACPISGRSTTLTSPRAVDTAQLSPLAGEDDSQDEQTSTPGSPLRRISDRSPTQLGAILEDECDSDGDGGDKSPNLQWGSYRNSVSDGFVGSDTSSFRKPRAVSPDAQMRRDNSGNSLNSMSQAGSALGIEVRMESASRCDSRPLTHTANNSAVSTVDRAENHWTGVARRAANGSQGRLICMPPTHPSAERLTAAHTPSSPFPPPPHLNLPSVPCLEEGNATVTLDRRCRRCDRSHCQSHPCGEEAG